MSKSEAGRLGGLATFAKYGRKHMKAIAKRGAIAFWRKYDKKPIGQTEYAIIRRSDNVIIAIVSA